MEFRDERYDLKERRKYYNFFDYREQCEGERIQKKYKAEERRQHRPSTTLSNTHSS
jgi:hypothetical protein